MTRCSRADAGAVFNYPFLTQKERDIETGLDYSINRYYSSMQGRFTSVDPENAGAFEDEPQSWNGYGYVGNMPLIATDPLGLWKQIECSSGKGKCWESDNKSDTITSLAKILHVSPSDLNNFFQNPSIHIGDQFDVSGFYRNNTNTIWTNVVQVYLVSEPRRPQDNAAVATALTALRLDPEPDTKVGGAAAIAFYLWLHRHDGEVLDYVTPPRNLPAFPDARRVRRRGNRVRWQDDDGNIYEWDYQHGRVEKYDRRGRHLGEFDPETGEQTKPADPSRRVDT